MWRQNKYGYGMKQLKAQKINIFLQKKNFFFIQYRRLLLCRLPLHWLKKKCPKTLAKTSILLGRIYIKLHFFADFSAMCLAWNENYVSYLLTKCRNLSHHKPNEFSTQHVFQKSRFVWFKQQLLSFLIYFLFQDVEYVAANKHF